jgi:hypothetical protein
VQARKPVKRREDSFERWKFQGKQTGPHRNLPSGRTKETGVKGMGANIGTKACNNNTLSHGHTHNNTCLARA